MNPTHHSSWPLSEDHWSTLLLYPNTPALRKPPDYIKCCLALAFRPPQLDHDPPPHLDSSQEPKEPRKPGTPLFRLLHILQSPPSYSSESTRHFSHSHAWTPLQAYRTKMPWPRMCFMRSLHYPKQGKTSHSLYPMQAQGHL